MTDRPPIFSVAALLGLVLLVGCPAATTEPDHSETVEPVDTAETASATVDADADGFDATLDCDDDDPDTWPGADEVCDKHDNDCDGAVDEDSVDADLWYVDVDGDAYGDAVSSPVSSCTRPEGYRNTGGDCDDSDADIHPGATESCHVAVDANCDGAFNADCDAELDAAVTLTGVSVWSMDVQGDVDGDGIHDLVIGDGGSCPGTAWAVSSTLLLSHHSVDVGTVSLTITDDGACDYYGWEGGGWPAMSVPDADGDGRDDIAVGNQFSDEFQGSTAFLLSDASGRVELHVPADVVFFLAGGERLRRSRVRVRLGMHSLTTGLAR